LFEFSSDFDMRIAKHWKSVIALVPRKSCGQETWSDPVIGDLGKQIAQSSPNPVLQTPVLVPTKGIEKYETASTQTTQDPYFYSKTFPHRPPKLNSLSRPISIAKTDISDWHL